LPVLTITGSYDGDQPGALTYYREHLRYGSPESRARHFLVIGPWDHAGTLAPKKEFAGVQFGPAALLDVMALNAEWYEWTLLDGTRPKFLENNVAYYVIGAERWRYADTLEAITSHSEALYLDSESNPNDVFRAGALDVKLPQGRRYDSYIHDPRDLAGSAEADSIDPLCLRPTFLTDSLTDQRLAFTANRPRLIYHSSPFATDREISGFFGLHAWISIDQPDTDFNASIYEIEVSGTSVLLTSDSMRARYRTSLREEHLIDSDEPLLYKFERFTFISRLIRRSSRLRLVIEPINSIYSQRNCGLGGVVSEETMGDARPVTVKVFHASNNLSVLIVPFGHLED
jgi:putative CocE/NonD family hydrolase